MGKAVVNTLEHEWVQMTITSVTVVMVAGEAVVLTEPEDAAAAQAESQVGCRRCSLPLHEGIDQLCGGE